MLTIVILFLENLEFYMYGNQIICSRLFFSLVNVMSSFSECFYMSSYLELYQIELKLKKSKSSSEWARVDFRMLSAASKKHFRMLITKMVDKTYEMSGTFPTLLIFLEWVKLNLLLSDATSWPLFLQSLSSKNKKSNYKFFLIIKKADSDNLRSL